MSRYYIFFYGLGKFWGVPNLTFSVRSLRGCGLIFSRVIHQSNHNPIHQIIVKRS